MFEIPRATSVRRSGNDSIHPTSEETSVLNGSILVTFGIQRESALTNVCRYAPRSSHRFRNPTFAAIFKTPFTVTASLPSLVRKSLKMQSCRVVSENNDTDQLMGSPASLAFWGSYPCKPGRCQVGSQPSTGLTEAWRALRTEQGTLCPGQTP